MKTMSVLSVIRQFENETEQWRLVLFYIEEENVCFKNRLSDLLSEDAGVELLETAEKFLEEFAAQDRTLRYLNEELRLQIQLLKKEYHESDDSLVELMKNQMRLRKNMETEQLLYRMLKSDFNKYLCKEY